MSGTEQKVPYNSSEELDTNAMQHEFDALCSSWIDSLHKKPPTWWMERLHFSNHPTVVSALTSSLDEILVSHTQKIVEQSEWFQWFCEKSSEGIAFYWNMLHDVWTNYVHCENNIVATWIPNVRELSILFQVVTVSWLFFVCHIIKLNFVEMEIPNRNSLSFQNQNQCGIEILTWDRRHFVRSVQIC